MADNDVSENRDTVDGEQVAEVPAEERSGEIEAYESPNPLANLTQFELTALHYAAQQFDNLWIAAKLSVPERQVKNAFTAIYKKLPAENRTQSALKYLQFARSSDRPS
ncbi:LuxR C-terminal-related transcriptional regulator [Streptomyces microflavus]|uniref:LuxR C-terminal-related transcriptional regulator n=1 Tax=Streptomyces microflavus TaxID=1919 RepID=UPI0033ECC8F2